MTSTAQAPDVSREAARAVRERPMLFSGAMVRAILDGRKTQTRRVLNKRWLDFFALAARAGEISDFVGTGVMHENDTLYVNPHCPYGLPGDRLWAKETHGFWCHSVESVGVEYAAGGEDKIVDFPGGAGMPSLEVQCRKNIGGRRRKRPSIFMPRWASRLTLEITGVRVERLQDVSEEDAKAEGVTVVHHVERCAGGCDCCRCAYREVWESINGTKSWEFNPWVWCISFRHL